MRQSEFVVNAIQNTTSTEAAVEQVAAGLRDGTCPRIKPLEGEKEILKYAKALVANYSKKSKLINGGVDYVPANPRGPRDSETTKKLKAALAAAKAHKLPQATLDAIETKIAAQIESEKAAKSKDKVMSEDELLATLESAGIAV
jgi:hypothetical protein